MTVSKAQLSDQLQHLGVQRGGVLVVHSAFSQVKPVEGGVRGLIEALEEALASDGTLIMPSMSYEDNQVFDPHTTPCIEEMGVLADTFWRLPHVLRSGNAHAFAASGKYAELITAPHPLDMPHGPNSPIGRVYELGGQILLLGVGHDANTTIHLAESLGNVPYRSPKYLMIEQAGKTIPYHYSETDHCCQNFQLLDAWLDAQHLQKRGKVGNADTRLMFSKDVIETALAQLRVNPTVFLHPRGTDEECDAAWASIGKF